jgi:TetR/AcrR family transcriptional regulator, regulator of cefoperazone and chloramphenicol sensitivity
MLPPPERILESAEQIFDRKGFKAATVREICRNAGVNLAAVNYYFGGKTALYSTVVSRLLGRVCEENPLQMEATSPEERLEAFVRTILNRLLAPGGLSSYQSHSRLLAREMADPSPVLDAIVESYIRPQAAALTQIVQDLIGSEAPRDQIMRCAFSIIGQCFHYGYAWPIIVRLCPMDLSDRATIDTVARHIVAFSLNGVRHFATKNAKSAEPGSCPNEP